MSRANFAGAGHYRRAEKIIGEHCRAVAAPVRYFRMGCQYRPPLKSIQALAPPIFGG